MKDLKVFFTCLNRERIKEHVHGVIDEPENNNVDEDSETEE
jgi:hypothetical protein